MIQLSSPLMASVQITDVCNCHCKYCYNISRENSFISIRAFGFILEAFSNLFHIVIEGGEPFLHENLFEFCEKIEKKNIDYTIITNGTQISETHAIKLSKLKCNIIVSLDSPEKEINNKTRGNFDDAMLGISNLIKYKKAFGINTVINKYNIDSCAGLINRFYPNAKHFSFLRLIPRIDNDLQIKNLLSYTKKQIDELKLKIQGFKCRYPDIKIISPFNYPNPDNKCFNEALDIPGCLAGTTYITVKPNLDVIPCSYSQECVVGNLNETSFEDVWISEKLNKLRRKHDIPCLMAI